MPVNKHWIIGTCLHMHISPQLAQTVGMACTAVWGVDTAIITPLVTELTGHVQDGVIQAMKEVCASQVRLCLAVMPDWYA